jgi:hypothetical protein
MSAAPFFDFDALTDTDLGDVFAEHSVSGDWIAFHGTSSVNENEIDNTGIHGAQISTEKEIADLVSIYRSMNWHGRSSGGFGVLASFTWQRTIGVLVRPVYLSHYAERCLLYSTRQVRTLVRKLSPNSKLMVMRKRLRRIDPETAQSFQNEKVLARMVLRVTPARMALLSPRRWKGTECGRPCL